MNHTIGWSFSAAAVFALAALAALAALGGPAAAANRMRGDSPGTLGTEVPLDSPEADSAYHVRLPTDSAEALRFRDAVQRLLADHEGALALAAQGAQSPDPRIRALARQVTEDVRRLDEALRRIAVRGERFELTGAAYEDERATALGAAREAESARGAALDPAFLSGTERLLESATKLADESAAPAREESRLVLGSHLDREKKVLGADLAAVRAARQEPTASR